MQNSQISPNPAQPGIAVPIRFEWLRLNVISEVVIKYRALRNNWGLFLFLKFRDSKADLGFGWEGP